MEVRCGSCNKLFRVADEKITGTGVKFSCTRCSEYVKITHEDFEQYVLSQSAASALDLFVPKPKVSKTAPSEEQPETAPQDSQDDLLSEQNEPAALFTETDPFAAVEPEASSAAFQAPQTETAAEPAAGDAFLTEQQAESAPAYDFLSEAQTENTTEPLIAPAHEFLSDIRVDEEPEPASIAEEAATSAQVTDIPIEVPVEKPVPASSATPEPAPVSPQAPQIERKPEPKVESKVQPIVQPMPAPVVPPKVMAAPVASVKTEAPRPVPPAASRHTVPPPQSSPKKEPIPVEPASVAPAGKPVSPEPGPGKLILYVVLVVLALAAGGYGIFAYLQAPQKEKATGVEMVSNTGLHIVNPAGSIDTNGDLLITGTVENIMDQERTAWYVVVDVFNAQGVVLDKVRMLNGKQIFTKKDYEAMAKRGENIQELKAKLRQQQGIVVPAKGSIPFTIRYIQPQAGIASFNASLHPFDPAKLYKEIAEDTK